LPVQHSDRYEGKSAYNFKSLIRLALDSIIAFSDKPLRLAIKTGLFMAFVSFIIGIIIYKET
jgi:dolichol-phosphate mannosyltransferase